MQIESAINLINKTTRNLDGYHLNPTDVSIKLNQNELPFDWSDSIKKEVADFCQKRSWNRYPDFIPNELKQKIANFVGLKPENVIAGNGSNEMLLVLLLTLASKERPVITCQPTFTVYSLLSRGLGCDAPAVSLNDDLSFNVDAIKKEIAKSPESILVLCSPNNPTGISLEENELKDILNVHKGFLILDQAYIEFGGYNAIPLLNEFPNLIITRTFSKAFGGAGLRIGYMLGNKKVIYEINKMKLPYNINFFSIATASAMLNNYDHVKKQIDIILNERTKIITSLKKLPIDNVYDSQTNFILFKTSYKDNLFNYLNENDILIRDVSSYPMLDNCLRVTIGTPTENKKFIEVCNNFFKNKSV